MKKQHKKLLGVLIALAIIVIIVFYFFFPLSFEQEYARMSLAWKENGLSEERLHASEQIFSMKEPQIEKIKNELVSFKNSTRNETARDLVEVYVLFVENALHYSSIQELRENLASSKKTVCENLSVYEEMSSELAELKQKRNDYLNAVNSFVLRHPREAESISLYKTLPPSDESSLEPLIEAISVVKEEC